MAIALISSAEAAYDYDGDELEDVMPREHSERERLMEAVNFLLEIRSAWPEVEATVFAHQELRDRVISLERIIHARVSDPPPSDPPPPPYDLGKYRTGTGSNIIMTVEDARREGFVITDAKRQAVLEHDARPFRWFKKFSKIGLEKAYSHIVTIVLTGATIEIARVVYELITLHK